MYLEQDISNDFNEKMAFLGGPRKVGKTTLAFNLLGKGGSDHPGYLNWDILENKRSLLRGELPGGQNFVVLDEIHNYKQWRNLVKGFYDQFIQRKRFLVTGSAKLDYYRRGGDSLQGGYH